MDIKRFERGLAEVKASNSAILGKIKSLSESPCVCFGACRDQAREDEFTVRLTALESKSDAHAIQIQSLIDSNRKKDAEIEQLKSINRQLQMEIVMLKRQSNSIDTSDESTKLPMASGFDRHTSGSINGRPTETLVETVCDRTEGPMHYNNLNKFASRQNDMLRQKPLLGSSSCVKEARPVTAQNTDVRRTKSTTKTRVDSGDTSEESRIVPSANDESMLENPDYETNGRELVLAQPLGTRRSLAQTQETRLVRREEFGAVSRPLAVGKHGCAHQTMRKKCFDLSWSMGARREKDKVAATMEGHFDAESVDTVLCVDTSESMAENGSWERTCNFVYDYLSGLEEMAATPNLPQERVALVTFGCSNKVRQHLTTDMQAVRAEFDTITLGGPSPMFGGLILCTGAVAFKLLDVNGVEVYTKIILITDGKPTETGLIEGPDVCDPNCEQGVKSRILDTATQMSLVQLDVFCVAVGEEKNDFLELFVEMSDGIMVSHEDGQVLSRRLYMTMEAAQEQGAYLFGLHLGYYWDEVHNMMCRKEESPAIRMEKRKILLRSKRKEDQRNQLAMEEVFLDTNDPMLPKVGTRVRRGPDGNPETMSDNNGPGTVTGHSKDRGNLVVTWDCNVRFQICRYGENAKYDVVVVDEPRVVSEETRMEVGCVVCTGRHFRPSETLPDRNLTGIALGFSDDTQSVKEYCDDLLIMMEEDPKLYCHCHLVKWENGANVILSYSERNEQVVLLRDRQRSRGQRSIEAPPAMMRNGKKNKNQGK